ncbi:hypothetical protein G7B40_002690 [Aetokthonos hydrillicola Thurmond2011]|uniref:SMP-30/Gluconolactonase/LRE-like region domain-containing protein n=1 Tax=Aetokthonos hydrillicola Thurmond2011 TaxID=2712845 RepID=A0AAP5M5V3_9CYAN|nr:hypothetical protein [Aetokthonos hydrillicola]MBO3459414.1 hypothetical protein [Aetokthonos hydrillicola CCALA 1050]MBW4586560.1 hypothetical protein [Aetokthonos hydrillicola CCALA 1050]MDR9893495.1 hypothetical protein [Aetokthonos hydrillicola Thurmond2011]
MMRNSFKFIPLGTVIALIHLTSLKALADLYVSNVANEPLDKSNPAIVNYDPVKDAITDNFTPGKSSILRYDEKTGEFLGTFIPPGIIGLSSGITFGSDGNLYACDQANDRILRFNGKTGVLIDTYLQFGPDGPHRPEDIVFGPDGALYISGLGGGGVQRYDRKTHELTVLTQTNSKGKKLYAGGINFGPDGNLYISSVFNDNSIIRYNIETGVQDTFVPPNIAQPVPSGTVFSPDGEYLYDGTFIGPSTIERYDSKTGSLIGDFVSANNNGGLQTSSRLKFGSDGNLYVSDYSGSSIRSYDGQTGAFISVFVSPGVGGLQHPGGIAFFTPHGNHTSRWQTHE